MDLKTDSIPFIDYLEGWQSGLPAISLAKAIPDPTRTAIVSVDMINGFCYEGPLSSPRVARLVPPITRLFTRAWDAGVRSILLIQDTHEPDAIEFAQWPPHCVRGSSEAETVKEIKALPFFNQMEVFQKNSIQSTLNTGLPTWIADHSQVNNYIVVGDCTNLCTYQLAMTLRLDANARQVERRVLLPADCVDTYDLPVESALSGGLMPHPGNFTHATFLYHMALNGVEVVKQIGDYDEPV